MVIAENPQLVEDYRNGEEKAIGFLVGQTMKAMKAIIRSNCERKGERNIMCEALYEVFVYNLEEREERGFARGEQSGEIKGRICSMIELVCRKLRKGKSAELIAEELDTDYETIKNILRDCRI